jgi:hypothetical protein
LRLREKRRFIEEKKLMMILFSEGEETPNTNAKCNEKRRLDIENKKQRNKK